MGLFGHSGTSQTTSKKGIDKSVNTITYKDISRTYDVGDTKLRFSIKGASYGKIDGKEVLLDEELVSEMLDKMCQAIKSTYTKYNPVPAEVVILHRSQTSDAMPTNNVEDGGKTVNQPFEAYSPKISLNQVVLNEDVKQQIKVAITAVKNRRKMLEDWKMPQSYFGSRAVILNFYGKAGTGKSMAAEAIADTLGKKVYKINYSELESKYVGETPKNIRRAFDCASKDDAVLIFDEADSFLGKRLTSVTQSSDYGVNITRSVLLMELEKFEGVVVFTTNLIKNYDEAFKRRILLSVYFDMPDEEAREAIWRMHINPEMPIAPDVTMEELAKRFTDVSGADIRDTVFYAALHALEQDKEIIGYDSFDYAYNAIRERYRDHEIEDSIEIISDERIPVDQVKKTEEKNGGDC